MFAETEATSSFSPLCINRNVRLFPSSRPIMNPGWGQQQGAVLPWREAAPCLFDAVQIRRVAAVVTKAGLPFQIAVLFQIGQRPLDGGAGEGQIGGDGVDPGPAYALGGGAALEVHIHRLGPVGQGTVTVDAVKIAHQTLMCSLPLCPRGVLCWASAMLRISSARPAWCTVRFSLAGTT